MLFRSQYTLLTVREEIIQSDLYCGKEQYTLLTVREEIIQSDLYCGKEPYTLVAEVALLVHIGTASRSNPCLEPTSTKQ